MPVHGDGHRCTSSGKDCSESAPVATGRGRNAHGHGRAARRHGYARCATNGRRCTDGGTDDEGPKKAPKPAEQAKGREGSKTAQVVAILQRKNGATLAEIMDKMGWQKHTVRGFMAGAMKKAGHNVESFKPEGGQRTYRIK